jgi:hypothetical protein
VGGGGDEDPGGRGVGFFGGDGRVLGAPVRTVSSFGRRVTRLAAEARGARAACRCRTDFRGADGTMIRTGGFAGGASTTTSPGPARCATGPASKAPRQK